MSMQWHCYHVEVLLFLGVTIIFGTCEKTYKSHWTIFILTARHFSDFYVLISCSHSGRNWSHRWRNLFLRGPFVQLRKNIAIVVFKVCSANNNSSHFTLLHFYFFFSTFYITKQNFLAESWCSFWCELIDWGMLWT